MRETRLRVLPSERLVQEIVQRQGREPFLPADDLGNLHEMVVHDVRQVVCRQLVRPFPQHLVVKCVRIHLDVPADEVVHLHHTVIRHLEADGPVGMRLQKRLPLALRHGDGVAQLIACDMVVDEGPAGSLGFGPLGRQLLGCVECIVCVAFLHQFLCVFAVDTAPLGLPVRCMRMSLRRGLHYIAFCVHPLVGDDAAPVECFYDIFLRSRDEPLGVGVFNPYDEIPSVLLGVEVVVKSCTYSAHMQRPRRRRGKSYSCLAVHFYMFLFSVYFVYVRIVSLGDSSD